MSSIMSKTVQRKQKKRHSCYRWYIAFNFYERYKLHEIFTKNGWVWNSFEQHILLRKFGTFFFDRFWPSGTIKNSHERSGTIRNSQERSGMSGTIRNDPSLNICIFEVTDPESSIFILIWIKVWYIFIIVYF